MPLELNHALDRAHRIANHIEAGHDLSKYGFSSEVAGEWLRHLNMGEVERERATVTSNQLSVEVTLRDHPFVKALILTKGELSNLALMLHDSIATGPPTFSIHSIQAVNRGLAKQGYRLETAPSAVRGINPKLVIKKGERVLATIPNAYIDPSDKDRAIARPGYIHLEAMDPKEAKKMVTLLFSPKMQELS